MTRLCDVVGNNGGGLSGASHGSLSDLSADDHSQYLFLAGRAGGQIENGGINAGDDLELHSTIHATKGLIKLGGDTGLVYDEVNGKLSLGILSGDGKFHILSASAGSVAADGSANSFIIENLVNGGMSFLGAPGVRSSIVYGNSNDNTESEIRYVHGASGNDGSFNIRLNGSTTMFFSDSRSIGLNTNTPDATALLDMTSTTKGLLPPRLTTTQRDAISTPPEGLSIINLTTHQLEVFNGSIWEGTTGLTESSGTFSPELWDDSLSGSEGQTYSFNNGVWKKQGNVIHVQISMLITSLGSLTTANIARIGNFPFVSSATNNANFTSSLGFDLNTTALAAPVGTLGPSLSNLLLRKYDLSTGTTVFTVAEFSADGRLDMSGSYFV